MSHYLHREVHIIHSTTGQVTVFVPLVYDNRKTPLIMIRQNQHFQVRYLCYDNDTFNTIAIYFILNCWPVINVTLKASCNVWFVIDSFLSLSSLLGLLQPHLFVLLSVHSFVWPQISIELPT